MDTIYNSDCIEGLKLLPDCMVNTCVTSPPYFGLRDYGVDGQIGLEQSPDDYVGKILAVFREVRRVLRDDGTLWLNLGDSYASGKPKDCNVADLMWSNGNSRRPPDGLKAKDLCGIPWMVAFALRADGWYLRSDIIWHKPNPMPESVTDRPTKAHEYIFLLSKSPQYYYDHEAIKEDAIYTPEDPANNWQREAGKMTTCQVPGQSKIQHRADRKRGEFGGKYADIEGKEAFRAIRQKRNKRTVWTVSTKPFSEAHFATFPTDLIKPCILAGCPVGGVVLDPFMGAGTTGLVAFETDRHYIGFELNPDYINIAEKRIAESKRRKDSLGIPLWG